jgi:hypothetical protein
VVFLLRQEPLLPDLQTGIREKGEDAIVVAVEAARAHESDEKLARMLQVSHLPFPVYRQQPWRRPGSLQVRHLPFPICRLASARRIGRMWQQ